MCLCRIISFFAAIILGVLVLAFFIFFGLAYEFVVLYTNKKIFDEEGYNDEERGMVEDNPDGKILSCGDYTVIFFIIIAGLALQPLYLIFYLMWGFMWFIKEYGWWCFIADYSF